MLVSSEMAQSIVEETEKVIKRNVNFMNSEAQIIASIDQARIGDFHEGAQEVLRTKQKVMITEDDPVRGVKAGVNLPVYLKDQIVGVIGITGSETEVLQLGEVIQKMTEILVKEAYLDQQLELEQQARKSFIDEWVAGNWQDDKLFAARGWMMEINVYLPRIVLVFDLLQFSEVVYDHLKHHQGDVRGELEIQRTRKAILDTIIRYFGPQKEAIAVSTGSSKYTVLLPVNPEKSLEEQKERIRFDVARILRYISNQHGFEAACGAGRYLEGLSGISRSFREADRAVSFAKTAEPRLKFYDEMGLESFISEISRETREDFIERMLRLNRNANQEQLLETLRVFFTCNQSINEAANQLFIHKNTLQYRLKKIKEWTGYDPRVLEDAVLLYVAMTMHAFGDLNEASWYG
ncbi:CdaR family transcriptional regulator [Marinicrinis sediminis]|uniref:CdaR family transcriptional regulator n=1 Tax=Marinicrinis sediminis TaxID=1652465 RepID=A0ABW5R6R4_9BACL